MRSMRVTGYFFDDDDQEHSIAGTWCGPSSSWARFDDVEIDGEPVDERDLTNRQHQALVDALDQLEEEDPPSHRYAEEVAP